MAFELDYGLKMPTGRLTLDPEGKLTLDGYDVKPLNEMDDPMNVGVHPIDAPVDGPALVDGPAPVDDLVSTLPNEVPEKSVGLSPDGELTLVDAPRKEIEGLDKEIGAAQQADRTGRLLHDYMNTDQQALLLGLGMGEQYRPREYRSKLDDTLAASRARSEMYRALKEKASIGGKQRSPLEISLDDPTSPDSLAYKSQVKSIYGPDYFVKNGLDEASTSGAAAKSIWEKGQGSVAAAKRHAATLEIQEKLARENNETREKIAATGVQIKREAMENAKARYAKAMEYKLDAAGIKAVDELDKQLSPVVELASTYKSLSESYDTIQKSPEAKKILFGVTAAIKNAFKVTTDNNGRIIGYELDPEISKENERAINGITNKELKDQVIRFYQSRMQAVVQYIRQISGKAVTDSERAMLTQAMGMSPGGTETEFLQGYRSMAELAQAQVRSAYAPYQIDPQTSKPRVNGQPGYGVVETYEASVGNLIERFTPRTEWSKDKSLDEAKRGVK